MFQNVFLNSYLLTQFSLKKHCTSRGTAIIFNEPLFQVLDVIKYDFITFVPLYEALRTQVLTFQCHTAEQPFPFISGCQTPLHNTTMPPTTDVFSCTSCINISMFDCRERFKTTVAELPAYPQRLRAWFCNHLWVSARPSQLVSPRLP